ncbi:hypothetical protein Q8A73_018421 [Channa argus]|nr:hypothetical protein Q8A73_018421 [Channa argus]
MDIEIAGEAVGRLLFELFSDICPKTSKNFEALCTGEQGLSQSGLTLCYKGCLFHRVVPNGWVQGGDISPKRKGNGGESIYGPTFEDESFAVSHWKRGTLGMANKGPHTNGSQFYITLQPTQWMDKTYVAFGQVVEGFDILRRLEDATTCNERPNKKVPHDLSSRKCRASSSAAPTTDAGGRRSREISKLSISTLTTDTFSPLSS